MLRKKQNIKSYIELLYFRIKVEVVYLSFDVVSNFIMPFKCNRIAIVGLFFDCNITFDIKVMNYALNFFLSIYWKDISATANSTKTGKGE